MPGRSCSSGVPGFRVFWVGVPSLPPSTPQGPEVGAVGAELEGGLLGEEAELADDAEAAAVLAGAAGVGDEAEALDEQGLVRLDALDGGVGHVQDRRGHAIGAVDAGAAASGAVVVELEVDPGLAVGVVASEAEADFAAAPGRRDATGEGLGHGPEHGMADAESGEATGGHGRGVLRVNEAALGCGDVEGAEEAAVGLDGGVDEALHHGVDVGLGVGEVGVDAALGLGGSAVEVDENLVAVDPAH